MSYHLKNENFSNQKTHLIFDTVFFFFFTAIFDIVKLFKIVGKTKIKVKRERKKKKTIKAYFLPVRINKNTVTKRMMQRSSFTLLAIFLVFLNFSLFPFFCLLWFYERITHPIVIYKKKNSYLKREKEHKIRYTSH